MRTSFCLDVKLSGNLISNLTMISPFLFVCLGYGRPSPDIRFSVFGLTMSAICSGFLRLSSVGTVIVVPVSAFETEKKEHIVNQVMSHIGTRCTSSRLTSLNDTLAV
jgi:hypothetical protein